MSITKHEILTVKTFCAASEVMKGMAEVPSDAVLQGAEIEDEWDSTIATFTFRREVTDD